MYARILKRKVSYQAKPVASGLEVVLLKPWITESFRFGWRISSPNIVTKFPCWFSPRFLNMGLYCLAIIPYSRISSSSPSFKEMRTQLCNPLVVYEHTWVHYSIISKWLFFLLNPLLFKYGIHVKIVHASPLEDFIKWHYACANNCV